MEQSDWALIEDVRAGSAVAFENLMKTYEKLVYGMCLAYTGNREDALDVTQNVFVKVYENLRTLRGAGSFKAWLLRIAHNESLNWARANARHGNHEELTAANAPESGAEQESDVVRWETRDRLRKALLHLNAKQQQAVVMRYFERLSISEIALILGCTEGNARNILFRSVQKLRRELVPDWRKS